MALNFLFPIKCYQCGRRGSYLCADCLKKIQPISRQKCYQCGRLSPGGIIHPKCISMQTKLSGLIRLYKYSSLVGKLIRDYKYHAVFGLKEILINLTVQGVAKNKRLFNLWKKQKFCLIPVPLFTSKKLFRGFDQTKEILFSTADLVGLNYNENLLIRRKWTSQQAKLSTIERRKNVRQVFELKNKNKVKNKNFVLFDDVWTSGSTIKSAAAVFRSAGAKNIWALTICG
jgi:competence protein ComFC